MKTAVNLKLNCIVWNVM